MQSLQPTLVRHAFPQLRRLHFFRRLAKIVLPVNFSVIIGIYAAACWGNHSCSHCWLSSTTFKMPSALLPVGLQLIPLCF